MTGRILALKRAASLAGAATAALLSAGDARAQQGGTTALEEIQVTGQGVARQGRKDTARGPVEGYVATRSSAGTKTDTPILETPRSVEVIGRKELEDRGVTTLPEAVRYSPGVTTNSAGFDPRFDQIYIRGFPVNTYGDYKDGLRQTQGNFAQFRTEPFQLERIDIIKGPAAVLYGQTTPGGLIDRISKRPTDYVRGEFFTQYRDTDRIESGVDLSGPLNADKTLLGRFIALGRIGDTDYDIKDERFLLNPSVTWAPTDDTELTVYGLVQKDETDSNVAVLNAKGDRTKTYNIRASDPSYDHLKQTQYQIGYEFEHDFNDSFTLRQNTRYNRLDMNARYLTGSAPNAGWNADGTVYHRGSYAIDETVDAVQSDTQLQSRFETGPLQHTLLTGLDYQWAENTYRDGTLAMNPDYDLVLADPQFGVDGPTPPITAQTKIGLKQTGLYAQDQIKFGGWNISLGLRHDWAERTADYERYNGTTPPPDVSRKDKAFSYNIGLLYAFENGISPYASYSTSFLPSTYRDFNSGLLKPTKGEQFEVGVKYQPPGSESLFTIAGYKITEKNAAKYAGVIPNSGGTLYYESVGEIETYGAELGARINIAQGLNVIASYNYNDAEITKDIVSDNVGNRPAAMPKHTASLWTDYAVPDGPFAGFGIGGGVRHVGSTWAENANSLKNDAYTLFDAAIRYDLGKANPKLKGMSVALNGNNLTDKDVVVCDSSRCYLSEGRTVTATLRYRW